MTHLNVFETLGCRVHGGVMHRYFGKYANYGNKCKYFQYLIFILYPKVFFKVWFVHSFLTCAMLVTIFVCNYGAPRITQLFEVVSETPSISGSFKDRGISRIDSFTLQNSNLELSHQVTKLLYFRTMQQIEWRNIWHATYSRDCQKVVLKVVFTQGKVIGCKNIMFRDKSRHNSNF